MNLIEIVRNDLEVIRNELESEGRLMRHDHFRAMSPRHLEHHLERFQEEMEVEELRNTIQRSGKLSMSALF